MTSPADEGPTGLDRWLDPSSQAFGTHLARTLLAQTGQGVLGIDRSFRLRLFNPAAQTMFGYQPGDVLGQPLD
ncbi:MAG TPA: PAS domain-containing protein, partial [Gammaproteobacteria bacterium]|nr:PAS domain-containing protein [Gammaproteobacteria bacterium]